MQRISTTEPAELRKMKWGELGATVLLTTILTGVIYGILKEYNTEIDIRNTSIEKVVMVTSKVKGGGKIPNIVYIRDGFIPIGVTAQTRWYWECEAGKPTKVRFSLKHHAYQDPYRESDRHKYFAYFFGVILAFCVYKAVSIISALAKRSKLE